MHSRGLFSRVSSLQQLCPGVDFFMSFLLFSSLHCYQLSKMENYFNNAIFAIAKIIFHSSVIMNSPGKTTFVYGSCVMFTITTNCFLIVGIFLCLVFVLL